MVEVASYWLTDVLGGLHRRRSSLEHRALAGKQGLRPLTFRAIHFRSSRPGCLTDCPFDCPLEAGHHHHSRVLSSSRRHPFRFAGLLDSVANQSQI